MRLRRRPEAAGKFPLLNVLLFPGKAWYSKVFIFTEDFQFVKNTLLTCTHSLYWEQIQLHSTLWDYYRKMPMYTCTHISTCVFSVSTCFLYCLTCDVLACTSSWFFDASSRTLVISFSFLWYNCSTSASLSLYWRRSSFVWARFFSVWASSTFSSLTSWAHFFSRSATFPWATSRSRRSDAKSSL